MTKFIRNIKQQEIDNIFWKLELNKINQLPIEITDIKRIKSIKKKILQCYNQQELSYNKQLIFFIKKLKQIAGQKQNQLETIYYYVQAFTFKILIKQIQQNIQIMSMKIEIFVFLMKIIANDRSYSQDIIAIGSIIQKQLLLIQTQEGIVYIQIYYFYYAKSQFYLKKYQSALRHLQLSLNYSNFKRKKFYNEQKQLIILQKFISLILQLKAKIFKKQKMFIDSIRLLNEAKIISKKNKLNVMESIIDHKRIKILAYQKINKSFSLNLKQFNNEIKKKIPEMLKYNCSKSIKYCKYLPQQQAKNILEDEQIIYNRLKLKTRNKLIKYRNKK